MMQIIEILPHGGQVPIQTTTNTTVTDALVILVYFARYTRASIPKVSSIWSSTYVKYTHIVVVKPFCFSINNVDY